MPIATVLVLILTAFFASSCSRLERVIKVADLPQTPEFEVNARMQYAPPSSGEKTHLDIGYVWKQNKLFFMPILNDDGRYVGYTGSEVFYVPLSKSEVSALAAKANVTLPATPSMPFWDAWGGKLTLLALLPPFFLLALIWDKLWRRFTTGMWDE